ncbi:MAG TPA: HEAT repeat domain-containing protein, partial [Stenomitos sp.]
MQLSEIKVLLNSEDPQHRMSAIVALRDYESDVAAPLLVDRLQDPEFIVRSFAAMGLGYKRTPEAFETLVEVLQSERDPNVRGEAANALSKYGQVSLPYLVAASNADDHWLLQLSILPIVAELDAPEILWDLCVNALDNKDQVVQAAALGHLEFLQGSSRHEEALKMLLRYLASEQWLLRRQVALS